MPTYLEKLISLKEDNLKKFSASLIPNIESERILGIRLPLIRKTASALTDTEREELLKSLPHCYHEEYQLHSFVICKTQDYGECVSQLEEFLPYVDNWAVCDSIRPECFKKNRKRLLSDIDRWLKSEHIYTKRFAIEMLMVHFLDGDFSPCILKRVADVKSGDYYLDMMVAWFFATALAKRWDESIPYIENRRLDTWVHNKTIQKAIESYRVPDENKALLRTLKLK